MAYCCIKSFLNGFVLDISGGNRDNGVNVIMYQKNSPPSDNQLWQFDYQPDGTFLIISKLHGKALDCGGQEKGTHLVMWDRHGRESQRWRTDGNYITSANGHVVEVENDSKEPGAHVILWTRNHNRSDDQLFELEETQPTGYLHGPQLGYQHPGCGTQLCYGSHPEQGYGFEHQSQPAYGCWPEPGYWHLVETGYGSQTGYMYGFQPGYVYGFQPGYGLQTGYGSQGSEPKYHYIQSHLSGLVLDIPGGSRDNGVQVITYPRKENSLPSDNQLWQFEYQPDGTFLIISKLHGKALDCGGQEKGTHLVMWDRHGRESQRWRTDGNYLVSMSGLVADVEEGRETPGTPVILWTRKKSHLENQLFDIIDV